MPAKQSLKDKVKSLESKVTCRSTDCKNDLHCFLQASSKKSTDKFGKCRECGAELVDWERVHRRDLGDIKHTFEALKHEKIRHHFWHKEIDQYAVNHALRKGRSDLRKAAIHRLEKYVGEVPKMLDGKKPRYGDGQQTPYSGNSIYYAQHATASCCRNCIEYWHNIPQDRDLTEDEIAYLADLVMLYIEEKLPQLTDQAQKAPRIRRQPPKNSSTE
jgi:hypothetical protein